MPALNDASGPICRSHGAALMAKSKTKKKQYQITYAAIDKGATSLLGSRGRQVAIS
jgi:hypothetical protein